MIGTCGFWIGLGSSRGLELHPLSCEIHHRFGPQPLHDLQELVAARAAIFPAIAAGLDFLLVPADADAEIDASVRQPVERAHFLRGVDRIALRNQRDAGAEAQSARSGAEKAEG